ncbi:MAG TPA: hypothetical protein VJ777_06060 [Mycobacterium sp.]|nr:hypothetical protein [Mycobacterium sp.]
MTINGKLDKRFGETDEAAGCIGSPRWSVSAANVLYRSKNCRDIER